MTEDVAMADLLAREADLARGTKGWTARWLVEVYDDDEDGEEDLADDLAILHGHDYVRAFASVDVLEASTVPNDLVVTFGRKQDAGDLGDLNVTAVVLLGRPATLVRTYSGKQQADANVAMAQEAGNLATYGYYPTTQSWAQGQWGAGAFVLALLLCIVLVGILVFLYLLIVKPAGTLTVTYGLRDDAGRAPSAVGHADAAAIAPHGAGRDRRRHRTRRARAALSTAPTTAPSPTGSGSVPDQIRQLGELRDAGLVTDEEFAAKKAELLGRM